MPRYGIVPDIRPRMTDLELINLLKSKDVNIDFDQHPIWVIGIRGYYLQTMGDPNLNDRSIYDDAIFIITKEIFRAYNANTDPGIFKKGIASLVPGVWLVYQLDDHRPKDQPSYPALCQRGGPVKVFRDNVGNDIGNFGINIHKGGYNKVSSIGCQTIYPEQWTEFISNVTNLAIDYFEENWNKTNIPYVLIENK